MSLPGVHCIYSQWKSFILYFKCVVWVVSDQMLTVHYRLLYYIVVEKHTMWIVIEWKEKITVKFKLLRFCIVYFFIFIFHQTNHLFLVQICFQLFIKFMFCLLYDRFNGFFFCFCFLKRIQFSKKFNKSWCEVKLSRVCLNFFMYFLVPVIKRKGKKVTDLYFIIERKYWWKLYE